MLNVAASILIWGTSLIVLLSILATGGVTFRSKRLSWLDKSKLFHSSEPISKKGYLELFFSSFALRMFMILFAALAMCLFMQEESLTLKAFLDKLVIWDANSYVDYIAKGGYSFYKENGEPITLVFFPMYSCLIRAVSVIVGNLRVAGLLVSALCFSAGCCFLFAYTNQSYGKDIAKKAVLYLSISPFGFYFGTLLSESTFFMMLCLCLYLISKNRWFWFAVAGVLCTLTRIQGVLILIPACIHWFEEYRPIEKIRKKDGKTFWQLIYKKLIFIPIPMIGIAIYLYINYRVAGNAFAFLDYQRRYWSHGYQYIGKALKLDFVNALTGDLTLTKVSIWIPQLFFFLLAIGLCIYGLKKHQNKLLAYLLAYTVVSYSVDWLISGARYMLTAVPMWIILAELGGRHPKLDYAIRTLSPILMGIYFVGYLFMKQIT